MSEDIGFHLGVGRVIATRPMALRVELEASSLLGAEKIWVPRSVIHDDSEVFADDGDNAEGELVVEKWFAEKQGWVTE